MIKKLNLENRLFKFSGLKITSTLNNLTKDLRHFDTFKSASGSERSSRDGPTEVVRVPHLSLIKLLYFKLVSIIAQSCNI